MKQGPLRVVFNQLVISLSGFGKSVFGRLADHYLQSKEKLLKSSSWIINYIVITTFRFTAFSGYFSTQKGVPAVGGF